MRRRHLGANLDDMFPNISLGRFAGIRVSISWSWLLILALIAWSLATAVFPRADPHLSRASYAAMGIAAAFLYLASILLHELGHALQARREGVETDGITLWLLGGVSRFRGDFRTPGAEFRTAVAGPFVSLAIGGISIGLAQAIRSPVQIEGVAAWLGYINVVLFVFNILPALPLDGGRAFHAFLWRVEGNRASATRVAAAIGRVFGYLLVAGGIALLFTGTDAWSGVWLTLVGWFLVQAATAESRQAHGVAP